MNILVLNWRDPKHPLAGGAEISLLEHIKYWQKKGENVSWYGSGFSGGKRIDSFEGIKIIRKGSHFTVAINFFIDWISGRFRETDLIIDCFHFIPFLTPVYIRDKKILAVINEVAGELWFKNLFFPLAYIGSKLEPLIFKLYNGIPFMTGSESAKKELIDVGISKNKITVVNHGIYISKKIKVHAKEKNPTLIYLGRIAKDKGIEDAIKIFADLKEYYKNLTLWVVGRHESPEYEFKLKQLINSLKVGNSLKFFGYVDENKKNELLSKAWLLIHPSTKEGWGLNVIESNLVGTPAIGYNVAGLVDSIKNNKTGLLVEKNLESFKNGVNTLLSDKVKLLKMGEDAKIWAKNFSWEKAGKMSYDLLIKITN